jgi:type I restriction enzyme R subunit
MSFTESNTVERMILEALSSPSGGGGGALVLRELPPGWGGSLGAEMAGAAAHWEYVPATEVPRQPGDVMVEAWLRLALIRLNPEIAAQPDRADEVIHALRRDRQRVGPTQETTRPGRSSRFAVRRQIWL